METTRRLLDKLFSGRFLTLLIFGFTLCALAITSLNAIVSLLINSIKSDPGLAKEILGILKDVLIFLLGSISGSFNKIWDAYTHRTDRSKPIIEEETQEVKSKEDKNVDDRQDKSIVQ